MDGTAVFIIFWFAMAAIVGVAANSRDRNGVYWTLLAILLSPLIAGVLVLALGSPGPNANTHKKCPACAEWCANEAHVCKHCGNSFDKPYEFKAAPGSPPSTGEFRG